MEVSSQGGRASVTHDEDGSSVSGSTRDKGRGSYKCGRCGVPKKGHICPYQPKLKRRPDEPPPETRNAAVQVEMDEFMTLRRLNIRIQGFPESYATEPFMGASMVGAEPHQYGGEPMLLTDPTTTVPMGGDAMHVEDASMGGRHGPPQPPQQRQPSPPPPPAEAGRSNTGTSSSPPPPDAIGGGPTGGTSPPPPAAGPTNPSKAEVYPNGPIAEITDLSSSVKEEKKEAA